MSCVPQLIIADEPTTALDATIQAQYLALLKDLQRQTNVAMIFVTPRLRHRGAHVRPRGGDVRRARSSRPATVRELFNDPQHPYTIGAGQLGARDWTQESSGWHSIEGQPPLLLDLPPGCRFAPRCYAAFDLCRQEEPPHVRGWATDHLRRVLASSRR